MDNVNKNKLIYRLLTKDEGLSVLSDLRKGVARKKWPFNPAEIQGEERRDIEDWTAGASWTDSSGASGRKVRNKIKEMHPIAKHRALHKLSSATKVKVDEEGKRHFLLHRGMSSKELEGIRSSGSTADVSSWTPNYDSAYGFADIVSKQDTGGLDPKDRVVSAWIPESQIHHIPNAIGAVGDMEEAHRIPDKITADQISTPHFKKEHEVIVKPHALNYADYTHTEKPDTLHDRINQRANNTQMRKSDDNTQMRKYDAWRKPTDEELSNEYDWEYRHVKDSLGDVFPSKDHFVSAVKNATVEDMPEDTDRATDLSSVDDIKDMTSTYKYPRDVDRISDGIKTGAAIPMPIVVRHDNGHFMMGGNTRQNVAKVHGVNPKVMVVDARSSAVIKSEGLAHLTELNKGVARKKWPFNPVKDVPHNERVTSEMWTGGYEDDNRAVREGVSRTPDNARNRALHKLGSMTEVKVKDGERHYLLHRGVGREEHENILGGMGTDAISSWSPLYNKANNFAMDYAMTDYENDAYDDPDHVDLSDGEYAEAYRPRVVSAWVPESQIHHIPNAIGSAAPDADQADEISPDLDPKEMMPHHRHDEHEIMVTNHKFDLIDHDLPLAPTSLHGRINQRAKIKSTMDKLHNQNPEGNPMANKPLFNKIASNMQDKIAKKSEATALLDDLNKSKNVREQRIKTYGSSGEPSPDTKAGKILHEKQSSAVNRLAEKRYGTDIKPSGGKFRGLDYINKQRKKIGLPALTQEEAMLDPDYQSSKDGRLFRPVKQKSNPKPDWRSGELESQRHIGAKVHEMAHLEEAPEGVSAPEMQEIMDENSAIVARKYSGAGKQTEMEIIPMAMENKLRRRAGIPAFGRPQKTDPRIGRAKHKIDENTPERVSLDTGRKYATRLQDPKTGEYSDLIAQSRNITPEMQERMDMVDSGELVWDKDKGWVQGTSINARINRKSRIGAKEYFKQKLQEARNNSTFSSASLNKSYSPKHGDVVHLSHGAQDENGIKIDKTKKYVARGKHKHGYRTSMWVVPVDEKDSRKGFYHRVDRMHPVDDSAVAKAEGLAQLEELKKTGWNIKIKGKEGYHKVKEIKDLGDNKGNNYVLHNGEEHHQDTVEDMKFDHELSKGIARKQWPFNPVTDTTPEEKQDVDSWVIDGRNRDTMEEIPYEAKQRALHKLGGRTQVKVENGERHYLLHRGVGSEEHSSILNNDNTPEENTSWSADYGIARAFADDYASLEDESENSFKTPTVEGAGKVLSAWVPESQIHHIPSAVGSHATGPTAEFVSQVDYETAGPQDIGSNPYKSEEEVIAKPHKLNLVNYQPKDDTRTIHSRINTRGLKAKQQQKTGVKDRLFTKSEGRAELAKLRKEI